MASGYLFSRQSCWGAEILSNLPKVARPLEVLSQQLTIEDFLGVWELRVGVGGCCGL